jgi:hypothetical protein
MLYGIYTAIKSHLTANDPFTAIKGIEWYNVQYEGSIASTPRLFIEFPDALPFDDLGKEVAKRAPVKLRIHVITQALSGADGAIDDSVALTHEDRAVWIRDLLDNYLPENNICKTIHFVAWQHFHKYKGWMVTFLDFTTKITI